MIPISEIQWQKPFRSGPSKLLEQDISKDVFHNDDNGTNVRWIDPDQKLGPGDGPQPEQQELERPGFELVSPVGQPVLHRPEDVRASHDCPEPPEDPGHGSLRQVLGEERPLQASRSLCPGQRGRIWPEPRHRVLQEHFRP